MMQVQDVTETDSWFLSDQELWPAINKIKAVGNRKLATAYIGSKVQFPWKEGDQLWVALSKENVRAGLVDPFYLEQLIKQYKIQLYMCERLHGKVFYFGDSVVVGSMNLSGRSQSFFLETAIHSRNNSVVASVKHFFEQELTEKHPIGEKELKRLQPYYKQEMQLATTALYLDSQRLWLFNTVDVNVPREQQVSHQYMEAGQEQHYIQKPFYCSKGVQPFEQVAIGDVIINLYRNAQGVTFLDPPLICVGIETKQDFRVIVCKQARKDSKIWGDLERSRFSSLDDSSSRELDDPNGAILQSIHEFFA